MSESINGRVSELMQARDLSQQKLAKLSGLSANWLSKLLNGNASWTARSVSKVAGALGVDPEFLTDGGDDVAAEVQALRTQLAEAKLRAVEAELQLQKQFAALQDARREQAEAQHTLKVKLAEIDELKRYIQTISKQRNEAVHQQRLALKQVQELREMVGNRNALLGVGGAVAALFGLGAALRTDDLEDDVDE